MRDASLKLWVLDRLLVAKPRLVISLAVKRQDILKAGLGCAQFR